MRYYAGRINSTEEIRKELYPDEQADKDGIFCEYNIAINGCNSRLVGGGLSSLSSNKLLSMNLMLMEMEKTWPIFYDHGHIDRIIDFSEYGESGCVEAMLKQMSTFYRMFTDGKEATNSQLLQMYSVISEVMSEMIYNRIRNHSHAQDDCMCRLLSIMTGRDYTHKYWGMTSYRGRPGMKCLEYYDPCTSYFSLFYPDTFKKPMVKWLSSLAMRDGHLYEIWEPGGNHKDRHHVLLIGKETNDLQGSLAGKLRGIIGESVDPSEIEILQRSYMRYPRLR